MIAYFGRPIIIDNDKYFWCYVVSQQSNKGKGGKLYLMRSVIDIIVKTVKRNKLVVDGDYLNKINNTNKYEIKNLFLNINGGTKTRLYYDKKRKTYVDFRIIYDQKESIDLYNDIENEIYLAIKRGEVDLKKLKIENERWFKRIAKDQVKYNGRNSYDK